MTIGAEAGEVQRHVLEGLGLPADTRTGSWQGGFPWESQRADSPADAWIPHFRPQDWERSHS